MLRAIALSVLCLLCCATVHAQRAAMPGPMPPLQLTHKADPGRVARAMALAGVVVSGLMVAGTVAIELVDDLPSEGVTRGVHLWVSALAAPAVALTSFRVRERAGVEGAAALRTMGWAFYAGAIALGVAQWYDALHDQATPTGMSYLYVGLAVLSLLPQCFDAYLAGRHAHIQKLMVAPTGLLVRF